MIYLFDFTKRIKFPLATYATGPLKTYPLFLANVSEVSSALSPIAQPIKRPMYCRWTTHRRSCQTFWEQMTAQLAFLAASCHVLYSRPWQIDFDGRSSCRKYLPDACCTSHLRIKQKPEIEIRSLLFKTGLVPLRFVPTTMEVGFVSHGQRQILPERARPSVRFDQKIQMYNCGYGTPPAWPVNDVYNYGGDLQAWLAHNVYNYGWDQAWPAHNVYNYGWDQAWPAHNVYNYGYETKPVWPAHNVMTST